METKAKGAHNTIAEAREMVKQARLRQLQSAPPAYSVDQQDLIIRLQVPVVHPPQRTPPKALAAPIFRRDFAPPSPQTQQVPAGNLSTSNLWAGLGDVVPQDLTESISAQNTRLQQWLVENDIKKEDVEGALVVQ